MVIPGPLIFDRSRKGRAAEMVCRETPEAEPVEGGSAGTGNGSELLSEGCAVAHPLPLRQQQSARHLPLGAERAMAADQMPSRWPGRRW